jgi:hypothetical protein
LPRYFGLPSQCGSSLSDPDDCEEVCVIVDIDKRSWGTIKRLFVDE